jgi:hypothetical protein
MQDYHDWFVDIDSEQVVRSFAQRMVLLLVCLMHLEQLGDKHHLVHLEQIFEFPVNDRCNKCH